MAMVESLDVKMVRRSSEQAERKRQPRAKKAQEGKTAASNRTNPVLRDGHPRSGRCPSGDRGRCRVGPRVLQYCLPKGSGYPKPTLAGEVPKNRAREPTVDAQSRQSRVTRVAQGVERGRAESPAAPE
jgi:hypothetical protein